MFFKYRDGDGDEGLEDRGVETRKRGVGVSKLSTVSRGRGVWWGCDVACHAPRSMYELKVKDCTDLLQSLPYSATLYHTPQHCTTPYHTQPHCTTLRNTVPHSTKLHHTVPHSTTLYNTVPHCTTLYHTVPHSTTLYYTIPHCTTLPTLHHTSPSPSRQLGETTKYFPKSSHLIFKIISYCINTNRV